MYTNHAITYHEYICSMFTKYININGIYFNFLLRLPVRKSFLLYSYIA